MVCTEARRIGGTRIEATWPQFSLAGQSQQLPGQSCLCLFLGSLDSGLTVAGEWLKVGWAVKHDSDS